MGRTWWDALAPAASPWRIRKKRGRHAVEMTRRGKRGKLQKQRRVSHASLRAWKSGEKQKRRIPTFPQRRRRRELDDSGGEENTKPDRSLAKKSGQLDVLRTGTQEMSRALRSRSLVEQASCLPSLTCRRRLEARTTRSRAK